MKHQAIEVLNRAGMLVEEKNGGNHLVIDSPQGFIDYWPTTGRWGCRSTKTQGQGFTYLMSHITAGNPVQESVNVSVPIELFKAAQYVINGFQNAPLDLPNYPDSYAVASALGKLTR